MKVGILGSAAWQRRWPVLPEAWPRGNDGTRTPAKLMEWAAQSPEVSVGSFADARHTANCRSGGQSKAARKRFVRRRKGPGGEHVIDATNPTEDAPPVNGVLKFFTSLDESLMERLQRDSPARTSSRHSIPSVCRNVNPQFKGGKPTMFICAIVKRPRSRQRILDEFGWKWRIWAARSRRAIEPCACSGVSRAFCATTDARFQLLT